MRRGKAAERVAKPTGGLKSLKRPHGGSNRRCSRKDCPEKLALFPTSVGCEPTRLRSRLQHNYEPRNATYYDSDFVLSSRRRLRDFQWRRSDWT